MIAVSPDALKALYAHARRDYPRECCGIVYGPRGRPIADRTRACVNIQDRLRAEDPLRFLHGARTAYCLDAGDVEELRRSFGTATPAKIVYHSHVDTSAYFGAADRAGALSAGAPALPLDYVVIEVRSGGPRGAKQFAWDAARGRHVQIAVYA